MANKEISVGDYVIATKYSDGDSKDHWCIGFYNGVMPKYGTENPRHDVVGNDGISFRGNGFRRVQKISAKRGKAILSVRFSIEHLDRSVWFWVRAKIKDIMDLGKLNSVMERSQHSLTIGEGDNANAVAP